MQNYYNIKVLQSTLKSLKNKIFIVSNMKNNEYEGILQKKIKTALNKYIIYNKR